MFPAINPHAFHQTQWHHAMPHPPRPTWPSQGLQGPQQKAPLGEAGLLPLRLRPARLLDHRRDLGRAATKKGDHDRWIIPMSGLTLQNP